MIEESRFYRGEELEANSDKQTYDVNIAGVPLKLLSAHSPETVEQLIAYVNRQIDEVMQYSKTKSIQSAAILASLNIAEELFLVKKTANSELDRLANRAETVLSQIETSCFNREGLDC